MSEERRTTDMLHQLTDELRLQAWLAGAELRNPSLEHPGTREEVDALVRLRDELRVQAHLGKLEAVERFHGLENRWLAFKNVAARAADDAEEKLHDVLRDIRDGYRELTS